MNSTSNQNEELSLKEVLEIIRDYFLEIIRNWKLVFLIILVFGLLFYGIEKTKPKYYKAILTFILDEGPAKGSSSTNVLDLLGISSESSSNIGTMLEITSSYSFLKHVLFKEKDFQGVTDIVANHLIRTEDLNKKWGFDEPFYYSEVTDTLTLEESKIFKRIYNYLFKNNGNPQLTKDYSEETGLVSISYKSKDALFATIFCNLYYDYLNVYFLENLLQKQEQTIDILKHRKDSFELILRQKEYGLANYTDSYRNTWETKENLPELKLQRDILMYQAAFGQATQNYEIALFNLENTRPLVQTIDRPFLPLPTNVNLIKQVLIGLGIGLILSLLFVIFRKIIRDTLTT